MGLLSAALTRRVIKTAEGLSKGVPLEELLIESS
jgi:hypothetical protein